jgi:hypothetical protein
MKRGSMARILAALCSASLLTLSAWAQQSTDSHTAATEQKTDQEAGQKNHPGAAHDVGSGAGNIGTGAAKGAGAAAKGVGKGAVDLATGHPINSATSVGKGAVTAGKNVTVGTVKGTGKIARGVGKTFKKIF